MRSYTDGGTHYGGQIGAESTPAEYIDALIDCTREWMRVLKPSGSLWVNLGDKYTGGGGQWDKDQRPDPGRRRAVRGTVNTGGNSYGLKPKSLLGLPWRYALRCIDELGLILRAEVIWSKVNGLPESVTDRVRRSHEQWFHLVKQSRYFSAVDEIREQYSPGTAARYRAGYGVNVRAATGNSSSGVLRGMAAGDGGPSSTNPLGKLPGSVWEIAAQPLTVPDHLGIDHFAAFAMEWPRRIIAGWSPSGICTACGEGRRPVTERAAMVIRPSRRRLAAQASGNAQRTATGGTMLAPPTSVITGEACACPDTTAPIRPAVVLDPFGGTGTTALVARALGRHGISVDRSADYCRLAAWRTTDPGQLAAALEVPKPPVQIDGQTDLFEATA